ncbi:hypothetical protein KDA11_03495 [Candidatus Saccharibacteria bacterium]|nr:hypothetical protein [Candidatus Saccharibacteria bacterium]MCA9348490.1 hypothetical protein [Candidatus Saccharibacteria bacterium]
MPKSFLDIDTQYYSLLDRHFYSETDTTALQQELRIGRRIVTLSSLPNINRLALLKRLPNKCADSIYDISVTQALELSEQYDFIYNVFAVSSVVEYSKWLRQSKASNNLGSLIFNIDHTIEALAKYVDNQNLIFLDASLKNQDKVTLTLSDICYGYIDIEKSELARNVGAVLLGDLEELSMKATT